MAHPCATLSGAMLGLRPLVGLIVCFSWFYLSLVIVFERKHVPLFIIHISNRTHCVLKWFNLIVVVPSLLVQGIWLIAWVIWNQLQKVFLLCEFVGKHVEIGRLCVALSYSWAQQLCGHFEREVILLRASERGYFFIRDLFFFFFGRCLLIHYR